MVTFFFTSLHILCHRTIITCSLCLNFVTSQGQYLACGKLHDANMYSKALTTFVNPRHWFLGACFRQSEQFCLLRSQDEVNLNLLLKENNLLCFWPLLCTNSPLSKEWMWSLNNEHFYSLEGVSRFHLFALQTDNSPLSYCIWYLIVSRTLKPPLLYFLFPA